MAASLGSQRQKRRELDARRSKCRIRLGGHMEQWCLLKKQLGFSLHSQLAKFLLDRYNSPGCVLCAGPEPSPPDGLQYLVFLSHAHSRECSLVPGLRGSGSTDGGLVWECSAGHTFSWDPSSAPAPPGSNLNIQSSALRNLWTKSGSWQEHEAQVIEHYDGTQESGIPRGVASLPETSLPHGEDDEAAEEKVDDEDDNLSDASPWTYSPSPDCSELGTSSPLPPYLPPLKEEEIIPPLPSSPATADSSETGPVHPEEDRVQPELDKIPQKSQGSKTRSRRQRQGPSPLPLDEDIAQIGPKRIRKTAKRELLPCDFPGCGKIFSNRQYLNHHKKYQHIHQKSFSCPEPSCGKSFNFKKHLKEHVKLHSDTRDYICEFCARSFRTSSNLIIHRRIHTGEKPLQCEICGFTCRQKASLNWHRRKHEEAAAAFQYPCEFCGKKFEKPDNVIAHCSKSHPTPRPGSSPTQSEPHLLPTISSSTSPILESNLSCESQKSPTLGSSSSSQIQRNQTSIY